MTRVVPAEQASSSVTLGPPVSVLVVDDDAKTAGVLAKLLHIDGFRAEVLVDVAEALARLARGPLPDFLVFDVSLTHGDIAAVQRIRARYPSLAIILVTAHPQQVEALARGSVADRRIVTKPIHYPALVSLLRAA